MPYELLARTFQEGDLIYGLNHSIDEALATLAKHNHKRVKRMYLGILQGQPLNKKTAMLQADITDAVWNKEKPTAYSSNFRIGRLLADTRQGRSYWDFLSDHERYNVAQQQFPASGFASTNNI